MTLRGRLRVALFAEQGYPGASFQSGVTRLTHHLVRRCEERGDVELDFFTYHPRTGTDEGSPVRYHRVAPRLPVSFHGLRVDALDILPWANPGFVRAAKNRTFDVVLGTSPGIGTQGQLLARERGLPFAAVYTTDLPHYAEALVRAKLGSTGFTAPLSAVLHSFAAHYLRWLYDKRRTALVFVPTEAARADFLALVQGTVAVLGRGADTLVFPEVRRASEGSVKLLYVGRIDYGQKNLRVLEDVIRAVEGAVLTVVGDGDDLKRMRQRLAAEEREGRVVFTGRVSDPARLQDLYLAADLFVFPSIYDTLGQVVLEAQSAGLPAVVRNQGGPPELVLDGVSGLVSEDDAAFVRNVLVLAADPQRRQAMGRAAREHARAMPGWSEIVDRLFDHLERLASRKNPVSVLEPS